MGRRLLCLFARNCRKATKEIMRYRKNFAFLNERSQYVPGFVTGQAYNTDKSRKRDCFPKTDIRVSFPRERERNGKERLFQPGAGSRAKRNEKGKPPERTGRKARGLRRER